MTNKKNLHTTPSILRGLTVQLFAVTVLPLTMLLLIIAFGSILLHQQDMRALVGQRDERAVQSAAAALESELHHRLATISSLAALAASSDKQNLEQLFLTTDDLTDDFDGGLAFLDASGDLIVARGQTRLLGWVAQNAQRLSLATSPESKLAVSHPFRDPDLNRLFVVVSAYSHAADLIVIGVFSPETLAIESLSVSYPAGSQVIIYLLDSARQTLYVSGTVAPDSLPPDHPGVAEALDAESGVLYVQMDDGEHVVAYSPIPATGWALITEETWESVISPSLQVTQMAPLVLVPAFILALIALWFGARQIVQPLQQLESKAAALAWGDFDAIKAPVGGISEVRHLQLELTEMARRVQAAQEGLRGYIGIITSAQEEERRRLARELHDDTIQAVIALKQRVQLAHKSIRAESGHQALRELEALSEETIENLRRLTRALRPIYLEDLGLVTALEMLARETSQVIHMEVDFHRSGQERRLPQEVELALYRIAQEALNNVVHHAKAKRAALHIVFDKEIKLEVKDDGVGFGVPKSPTDFAPSGHFGLLGMRERADLIGAKLEVRSDAGHGTRLSVRLALPANGSRREE